MSISDQVLAASDLARAAISESVPAEHVGAAMDVVREEVEDSNLAIATYTFASASPAYPGWYWSVAVVAIEGQDHCTVSEVNLLPGIAALVPPAWSPWAQRVQAGDLGVGDLLPTEENDERLTAGFTGLDELAEDVAPLHPAQWELGLGREQILSTLGLERAVDRWFGGDTGPRAAMAKSAPSNCGSCGFMVAIGGSIGQVFGVCANEFGAADGQVVATTFGCGAHSSVRPNRTAPIPVVPLVIDDDTDEKSVSADLPDYVADVIPSEVPENVEGQEAVEQLADSAELEVIAGIENSEEAVSREEYEPEFKATSDDAVEVSTDEVDETNGESAEDQD